MKKIIIANWKMNPQTAKEAIALARGVKLGAKNIKNIEIILAIPSIFFSVVLKTISGSNLKIGVQNIFYEKNGAYTGEISALQARSILANYIIVGHSERRAMGETNEIVHKKLKLTLESGARAILCVGEKEKSDESFPKIIRDEIHTAIHGIKKQFLKNLVVAYEPIWAISSHGMGEADTPNNVYEIAILIRREFYRILGKKIAQHIPILYGGSVSEKNAAEFVSVGNVDGLLVGGASLNAKKFTAILRDVSKTKS